MRKQYGYYAFLRRGGGGIKPFFGIWSICSKLRSDYFAYLFFGGFFRVCLAYFVYPPGKYRSGNAVFFAHPADIHVPLNGILRSGYYLGGARNILYLSGVRSDVDIGYGGKQFILCFVHRAFKNRAESRRAVFLYKLIRILAVRHGYYLYAEPGVFKYIARFFGGFSARLIRVKGKHYFLCVAAEQFCLRRRKRSAERRDRVLKSRLMQ